MAPSQPKMPLSENFELLELINRDSVETWVALEKRSAKRFLLHKIKRGTELRDRLVSMAPDDLIMLLRAEQEGDSYIVVTHDLPELRQFREWIESRSAPPSAEQPFDPDKTQWMPRPSLKPGISDEFAQMFQSPAAPSRPPLTDAPASAPVREEPASPPGEFTRLFQSSTAKPAQPPDISPNEAHSVPPPPRASSNESTADPGEFTRLFRAPAAAPLNPPVVSRNEPHPPAEPAAEPGEFTRIFQTSNAPASPPASVRNEPRPVPNQPPVSNTPASGPSEFTRIFSSALPPTPLEDKFTTANPINPEIEKMRPATDFTRMFGQPQPGSASEKPAPSYGTGVNQAAATGIFAAPAAPVGVPTQPSVPSGPGEYTRMFQSPASQPVSTEASVGTTPKIEKAPETQRKAEPINKLWPLVIVLAVLALASVALLLYFVMRR